MVVVLNGKSGCRLRKKLRSFTEEVGIVVVDQESGGHLQRKQKWQLLKENWWLWLSTEKVDVVYGESGCY